MIPEENKTAVISTGLEFMRSITEAYGADEGLKLWDAITGSLDPDVKGEIFFAMITGDYNSRIVLRGISASATSNIVPAIKTLRTLTGYGLKEAKDIVDGLRGCNPINGFSPSPVTIEVAPKEHHLVARELRNAGFIL